MRGRVPGTARARYRETVLDLMRRVPDGGYARGIAVRLGIPYDGARQALSDLRSYGMLDATTSSRGIWYRLKKHQHQHQEAF